MGLFGRDKAPEEKKEQTVVSIAAGSQLPGRDIAEFVADNARVPIDVRGRHWSRDLPSVALAKLDAESRRRLTACARIREDIRFIYEQRVYVYVSGVDLTRENNDLDYDLPFQFAMSKADNEDGPPLIDKLLSSSTLVETRRGETKAAKEEPSRRRKMFGII